MNIATRRLSSIARNVPVSDHRHVGRLQKLFFFDNVSKGSCFFLPRGARIYNKLVEYLRDEYKTRNYHEVITPNIYHSKLWEKSGHWEHYKDNIIKFDLSEGQFGLKPMNCPGHCIMFKHLGTRGEDKLPIRWADFGVLHRNEVSGSLIGLTRVRRFQQDDAHIFCSPQQVEQEVMGCVDFARKIYEEFDFKFNIQLSLRPDTYIGDSQMWDQAEDALRKALSRANLPWTEKLKEGAFYGPKIDLEIQDCWSRSHQCATIQLDFQLPEKFNLSYCCDSSEIKRPVIIHRAILGSIERFIAMIAENNGGRWPFWLSPVQAKVVSVHDKFNEYAKSVEERLTREGFSVEGILAGGLTLNKQVREAEISRFNFILVVGKEEVQADSLTVRMKVDERRHQVFVSVDRLIELFHDFEKRRIKHGGKALIEALSS